MARAPKQLNGIIIGPTGAGKTLWISSLVAAASRFDMQRHDVRVQCAIQPRNETSNLMAKRFTQFLQQIAGTNERVLLDYEIRLSASVSLFRSLLPASIGGHPTEPLATGSLRLTDGQGKTFFSGDVSDQEFGVMAKDLIEADFAVLMLDCTSTEYAGDLKAFLAKLTRVESLGLGPSRLSRVAVLLNKADKRREFRRGNLPALSPSEVLPDPLTEIEARLSAPLERLRAIMRRDVPVQISVCWTSVFGFMNTDRGLVPNVAQGFTSVAAAEQWHPYMVIEPLVFLLTGKTLEGMQCI